MTSIADPAGATRAPESTSSPIRSTLRFVAGKALVGGAGVLATMVLFRLLGAEDTGRLTLATVVATNLGLAAVGGVNEVLARFGPRADTGAFPGLLRASLRWFAVVLLVVLGALAAAVPLGVPMPIELRAMLVPLALMVAGSGLVALLLGALRGSGRYAVIPGVDASRNVVAKVVAIAVLVAGGEGFRAVFGVYVGCQLVAAAIAAFVLRDLFRGDGSTRLTSEHRSYAGWSFVAAVAASAVVALDPLIVRAFHDATAVGLVGAGMRIPRLLHQLVLSPVQIPVLYYVNHERYRHRQADVFREGMRAATAVLALVASIVFALADLLPVVLGEGFRGAETVLRVTLGWFVVMGVLGFCPTYFQTRGVPRQFVAVLAVQLVSQGLLAWWWVPEHAAVGAAFAAVGGAVVAVVSFVALLIRHGMGGGLVRPVQTIAAFGVASWLGHLVHPSAAPVSMLLFLVIRGETSPERLRAATQLVRRR